MNTLLYINICACSLIILFEELGRNQRGLLSPEGKLIGDQDLESINVELTDGDRVEPNQQIGDKQ